MIDIFTGFKVPPELCDWWSLPPAVRHPQKKHALGFLEHVSCGFCRCLLILLKMGRPLPRNVSNSRNCIHNLAFWNLHSGPAGPAGPPEVVAWSAARTLPSTRAGGQDDVSFTNSLKLKRHVLLKRC